MKVLLLSFLDAIPFKIYNMCMVQVTEKLKHIKVWDPKKCFLIPVSHLFSDLQLWHFTVLQPHELVWKFSKFLKCIVTSEECSSTFKAFNPHSKYPNLCSAYLVSNSYSKTVCHTFEYTTRKKIWYRECHKHASWIWKLWVNFW